MSTEDISFYVFQIIQAVLYIALLFMLIFYLRSPSKIYDFIESIISPFIKVLSKVTYKLSIKLCGYNSVERSDVPQETLSRILLQQIICPFCIIRGIILLIVARILLHPAQSFLLFTESRLELFLFLAAFLDIFSRTAGLITEVYKHQSRDKDESLELIVKAVRAFFLPNYGGQFIAPLWCCCVLAYLL